MRVTYGYGVTPVFQSSSSVARARARPAFRRRDSWACVCLPDVCRCAGSLNTFLPSPSFFFLPQPSSLYRPWKLCVYTPYVDILEYFWTFRSCFLFYSSRKFQNKKKERRRQKKEAHDTSWPISRVVWRPAAVRCFQSLNRFENQDVLMLITLIEKN